MDIEQQGDFKNALPHEVDDHPDSGMPRQLRTQNDNADALTREEAQVGGIDTAGGNAVVYADTDMNQNAEDQRDVNSAAPDEHL